MTIDLNCDMCESFGAWTLGDDAALLPFITSANVACGFHAGDPAVMRATVRAALRHNVAIGAHPGLPDLAGFGRRNLDISDLRILQRAKFEAMFGVKIQREVTDFTRA